LTACGRGSARTLLCPTCSWRRQHAIDGGTSLGHAARFTDLAVAAHWREFWLVLGSVRPTTINGRCAQIAAIPLSNGELVGSTQNSLCRSRRWGISAARGPRRAWPCAPERIYKPRRGLNDISFWSKSRYRRSLSRDRAVIWRKSDESCPARSREQPEIRPLKHRDTIT